MVKVKMMALSVVMGMSLASMSHADVLFDFETGPVQFVVNANAGGSVSSITHDSTVVYEGSQSLKISDTNSGQPYVESSVNHGDLSSLQDTYVDFAIHIPNPQNGALGTNALQVYLGTNTTNRVIWIVKESAFLSVAPDANGWYAVHLDLVAGASSISGASLNGTALDSSHLLAGTIGTPNWSSISYMSILPNQASGSDVWDVYVDQITIGEVPSIPEPSSLMGVAACVALIGARRR